MKMEEQTNFYLKNKKSHKNLYRPKYHFSPDYGWCNDPHGIVYFNGEYHLFFQFHPFDTLNKEMYWGHVTTNDFIHFSPTNVVIAPKEKYDNAGCWSGSVIIKDGTLYIFYTGFSLNDDGKYYQTVCAATSRDGKNFTKSKLNPLICDKDIPSFASKHDFRDPCIFKEGDAYYLLIGSKNENEAMLLLYKSLDLLKREFVKPILKSSKFGTMFECPNVVRFDNSAYIIMSPQNIHEKENDFFNVSSSVYFEVDKDFLVKENYINRVTEIDHGFEFYAPNVLEGEKIIVAREQMWGRRYYLHEISNDYINNFTLFKKIICDKGKLKFIPLENYKNLFKNEKQKNFTLNKGDTIDINNKINSHLKLTLIPQRNLVFNLFLCVEEDKFILVKFDFENKLITIDRTKMDIQLYGVDNTLATKGIRYLTIDNLSNEYCIEVYLDIPSVEIFLHDFADSISLLAFADSGNIKIESNQELKVTLIQHDIEVQK